MVADENDDAALVQAFKAGEREAFAWLTLRHRARVVRLAAAVLGDASGAEDIAQDACYEAYFGIERLREPAHFGSWRCGIGVNLARMSLRSARPSLPLDTVDGLPSYAGLPEDSFVAKEGTQRLQAALDQLPEDMRAAVWLHYVEGMSYDAAGAVTGATPGKLRVLSHRARRRLQKELSDQRPSTKRRRDMEVVVDSTWIRMRKDGEFDPVMRIPRWVVILKAKQGDRAMSIWMGPAESEAIARQLAGVEFPRPQTYSFVASLLSGASASVQQVTVTELVDDMYLARVSLKSGRNRRDVDARPSDAMNLALVADAPLFVSDDVFARMGFPYGELQARLKATAGDQANDDLEWRPGASWMIELHEKRAERLEAQRQAALQAARRFQAPPASP